MKTPISVPVKLILILAAMWAVTLWSPVECKADRKDSDIKFLRPLHNFAADYYISKTSSGQDVYIGANFLFQIMKLRSQSLMEKYESEVMLPLLIRTLENLSDTDLNEQARIFVSVARKLIDPGSKTAPELSEHVDRIVTEFVNSPINTPRGHYTKSPQLKNYFLGMQFLTRAVFDVQINRQWYQEKMYLVFPFDAWKSLYSCLNQPANRTALNDIINVSAFYDRINGPSDMPNLSGIVKNAIATDKQAVLKYAGANNLPRINRDSGVGIQIIGERFTLTQAVIDDLSQNFLANDPNVNRKKAFSVLRLRNVIYGRTRAKIGVTGVQERIVRTRNMEPVYYQSALESVFGLKGQVKGKLFINSVGASLTALAEQTILTTKETILTPKAIDTNPRPAKGVSKIYFQAGITDFAKQLGAAESIMHSACGMTSDTVIWKRIAEASSKSQPVSTDSETGIAILDFISETMANPAVAVDVFYFDGKTDKGFLQWGIVPYEVEYAPNPGVSANGIEMVFFEGWNNQIDKNVKKPFTNDEWRLLISSGKYLKFASPVFSRDN